MQDVDGKIEDVAEKAGQVMGGGMGGAVLVHVVTNNAELETVFKATNLVEFLCQILVRNR